MLTRASDTRRAMKKLFLIMLAALLLSGCSMGKVMKWINEMDWERDDQTIQVVKFLIK
jgi:hypothetical protein